MNKLFLKLSSILVSLALVMQLAACGTLLYPERRGQTNGDIDPGVAILDGIGLLFFIIPGLVAFAIDFSTGAIYLPRGKTSQDRLNELKGTGLYEIEEIDGQVVVRLPTEMMTPEAIDGIVRAATGIEEGIAHSGLEVYRLDGDSRFADQFQRLAGHTGGSTLRFN